MYNTHRVQPSISVSIIRLKNHNKKVIKLLKTLYYRPVPFPPGRRLRPPHEWTLVFSGPCPSVASWPPFPLPVYTQFNETGRGVTGFGHLCRGKSNSAAWPKPGSTNKHLNITVGSTEKRCSSSQRFLSRKNQDGFLIKNVGNEVEK